MHAARGSEAANANSSKKHFLVEDTGVLFLCIVFIIYNGYHVHDCFSFSELVYKYKLPETLKQKVASKLIDDYEVIKIFPFCKCLDIYLHTIMINKLFLQLQTELNFQNKMILL